MISLEYYGGKYKVELREEELTARLYQFARIEERQIDIQRSKGGVMRVMKMDPKNLCTTEYSL